jgi:signal transduction histidine kinase/AmiR/NasT family two-component response regulator
MKRKGNDVGSDTDGRGQPGEATQRQYQVPAILEKDIPRREGAVMADEAAVLRREKLVSAREDAAYLRENAADLRERKIRAAETLQAASVDHTLMLQQANEKLVIATIEAHKLTEQVEAASGQLDGARHVAEKANLAKSEFLSSMSHELRSPLNAILGFAQLLESGSPLPTPTQKASIDQILHAGWYLLELINEILDLTLIESGKLSLSMEPMSLPDVLLDCQNMIDPQARKNDIHVSFPQLDRPYFVYAARTRVKQVLVNLLSNAIKYNRAGGTVDVTCRAINTRRIRISVQDRGEGLPPEKLAQLFQPFNRLGQETGAEEGTGIGLVVAKRLVELMDGEIGADSTVGDGSVFWIELNLVAAPQLAGAADKPFALLQAQVQQGTALRALLYVEDNRANMQLVEQLIARRPDMRLLSATDGMHGIALARTHQPDVILMDINLPGISGIEVLKILVNDPATKHIPVLALSANAMPHDIEKGLAAGFFRYLTKPIKINEFMAALDLALEFSKAKLDGALTQHPCDGG